MGGLKGLSYTEHLSPDSKERKIIESMRKYAYNQKMSDNRCFPEKEEFDKVAEQLKTLDDCMEYEIVYYTNDKNVTYPQLVIMYDEDEMEYRKYRLA